MHTNNSCNKQKVTIIFDVVDVDVGDEIKQILKAMLVEALRPDVGKVVFGRYIRVS